MVYVERDEQGTIINLGLVAAENYEYICLSSPELVSFIQNAPNREELTRVVLDQLDLDMVRVIEDLIDILIERNLMIFTDLPPAVQNKLLFKRKIRNLNKEEHSFQEEEVLNL